MNVSENTNSKWLNLNSGLDILSAAGLIFVFLFRDYDSLSKENVFENNNLVSISRLCSCNSSELSQNVLNF